MRVLLRRKTLKMVKANRGGMWDQVAALLRVRPTYVISEVFTHLPSRVCFAANSSTYDEYQHDVTAGSAVSVGKYTKSCSAANSEQHYSVDVPRQGT
jgi:hypothetical protein